MTKPATQPDLPGIHSPEVPPGFIDCTAGELDAVLAGLRAEGREGWAFDVRGKSGWRVWIRAARPARTQARVSVALALLLVFAGFDWRAVLPPLQRPMRYPQFEPILRTCGADALRHGDGPDIAPERGDAAEANVAQRRAIVGDGPEAPPRCWGPYKMNPEAGYANEPSFRVTDPKNEPS